MGWPDFAPAQGVEGEVLGYLELRAYGLGGQGDNLDRLDELAALIPGGFELGFHPEEQWGLVTRARPTVKLHLGDQSLVFTPQASTAHGFFGRDVTKVPDVVTVERAYLSLVRGDFDLTLGKQLLRYGSGLLVNPTDVFNQRNLADLNAELPGVWAARVLWALGEMSNLQVAGALDPARCCEAVAFARYDLTLDATDGAVTAAYDGRRERAFVGLDVKTDLVVGAWLEGVWTFQLDHPVAPKGTVALEAGLDYSFDVLGQLYLAAEWIHQGDAPGGPWRGPTDAPPDYLDARRSPGGSGLLGSNYLLGLARLGIVEELQVQVMGLVNLADPSGAAVGQLTYWPTGALEFIFGAQWNLGDPGTEFHLVLPDPMPLPGPLGASLAGQRLNPEWMIWLWGKIFF